MSKQFSCWKIVQFSENRMVAKQRGWFIHMKMGEPSINFCMTLLVLSLLIISFHIQSRIEAVPTYSKHSCPNTSTFTINTPLPIHPQSPLSLPLLQCHPQHRILQGYCLRFLLHYRLCRRYYLRPLPLPWRHVTCCLLRLRRWINQRLNKFLSGGERCGGLVRRVHVEILKPLYIFPAWLLTQPITVEAYRMCQSQTGLTS